MRTYQNKKKDIVEHAMTTRRLKLYFWETVWHYFFTLLFLMIVVIFFFVRNPNPARHEENKTIAIVCLSLSVLTFIVQYRRLRFKTVDISSLSRAKAIKTIKQVAEELDWNLYAMDKEFMVALLPPASFNWGKRITILLLGDTLYVNCICDPNGIKPGIIGNTGRHENHLISAIKRKDR